MRHLHLKELWLPLHQSTTRGMALFFSSWTVSSEAFSMGDERVSFRHDFSHSAIEKGALGSAKVLVAKARKCHKGIPVPHPNSAIFICFAEERMDLCRAVVTGPTDTPYALGIFQFDVYFPQAYPQIPPLVQFMTTGGGQARFGPNLYQDGKVCLSLLGTFHAADESQQWNPRASSFAQILFLEPGIEHMMNTPTGRDSSRKYNLKVRLYTLRQAILDCLLNPPLGLEEVVCRHFALCLQRLVVQAKKRWCIEAEGSALASRFEKVYAQIVYHLGRLDEEIMRKYPPLLPLKEDADFVRSRDPSFYSGALAEDSKPPALPNHTHSVSHMEVGPELAANPWLTSAQSSEGRSDTNNIQRGETDDDGEDDDDFYS